MSLSIDQVGSVRRITLTGRLDADGVKAVEADFHAAATEVPNVMVDLSGVPFLASLGIRMLVSASQDQQTLGGKLVLVSPDKTTMSVLHTTGINQLIPVRDTIDEAASAF